MSEDTIKITVDQHDAINELESQISAMLHLGCISGLGGMHEKTSSAYMTALESKFNNLMAIVRQIVDQNTKYAHVKVA